MAQPAKPRTAEQNARLWGARAKDWSEIQEGQCRPVYLAVLDKLGVGPGIRCLDAGCGSGMAAQMAADRGAIISGVDAAPSLLAIARRRVPGGSFAQGDLESLPFAEHSFDCVTGFNSFQYAGNPLAALREAKRVSQPGATVVVMTWSTPEGMEAASLVTALRPLMPPAPSGAPGPFALSEESALRALACGADLRPLDILDVACSWRYDSLDVGLAGLASAGVAVRAIEHSGEAAVREAYTEALSPFRQSDGSYRIQAAFRCLLAAA